MTLSTNSRGWLELLSTSNERFSNVKKNFPIFFVFFLYAEHSWTKIKIPLSVFVFDPKQFDIHKQCELLFLHLTTEWVELDCSRRHDFWMQNYSKVIHFVFFFTMNSEFRCSSMYNGYWFYKMPNRLLFEMNNFGIFPHLFTWPRNSKESLNC